MPVRLNKYLSEIGYCSRREADRLIEAGKVVVDGVVASIGDKVEPNVSIEINGTPIKKQDDHVYILLNKPRGITSTTDQTDPTNVVDFVGYDKRIFTIGRLDKDSEGLLLLTNDGDIVNKILRSGNNHEKEYIVIVDKPITKEFLEIMQSGVDILGTTTKKARVRQLHKKSFNIVLTEGMNRQIRRMCTALGYRVFALKRVRIMNIKDDNLAVGSWRHLTNAELKSLRRLTKDSTKVAT